MFIDQAEITVKAGDGGHGCVSFRREKYVPNGGPNGGDGGRGGSVIFVVDTGVNTLMDFRHRRKYKAQNGGKGETNRCAGKSGEDLIIQVPQGTLVKNREGKIIGDLTEIGENFVVAKGGKGGLGNQHFSNSTRQAPRFAQAGIKGEEKQIILELKLLADVGLLGYPNVGKSTFLSAVSKARPKIANYHFTTIVPNLGVVKHKDTQPFVIADIPGLIEGAADGTGLGHQFLRHVERTKLLLHLLDVSKSEGREPQDDFEKINAELKKYNEKLAQREQIVVLNKIDLSFEEKEIEELKQTFEKMGYETYAISAATGEGVEALLNAVVEKLSTIGEVEPIFEVEEEVVYTFSDDKNAFTVTMDEDVYVVEGEFLERLINSVNFDDYDSISYFQKNMKDRGVYKKLEEMGIEDEDIVRILDIEFEYFK
jgi:GTP-binding protein